ncbi:class I SAM-dependent methyltransferase [Actinoplanes sp. GCM10030250]|uniref:class I SAM-dependent methyltransferase n=1 Tax=Actinoplanes sp. GCM10030250 TaxID=3273376 RepID=UPI0036104B8E
MTIDMDTVVGLYFKHADTLRAARQAQAALLAGQPRIRPRLDDAETEISYLLVRELRPSRVVEIGAEYGWSTTWLLRALCDNGHGTLDTYDTAGHAPQRIPASLAEDRWRFHQCDVRQTDDLRPEEIDLLFIDAVHTAPFARWYRHHLLDRLRPGTPVAVHDVFHHPVFHHRAGPSREGRIVLDWLAAHGASHFTVSAAAAPQEYAELSVAKRLLALDEVVHQPAPNPMLFCTAP